jgi:hypothetical protein
MGLTTNPAGDSEAPTGNFVLTLSSNISPARYAECILEKQGMRESHGVIVKTPLANFSPAGFSPCGGSATGASNFIYFSPDLVLPEGIFASVYQWPEVSVSDVNDSGGFIVTRQD